MPNELDRFIDVLHAIRFQADWSGTGAATFERMDELIAVLVAAECGRGGTSFLHEIGKRLVEAERNYDRETGRTYCGSMPKPPPAATFQTKMT